MVIVIFKILASVVILCWYLVVPINMSDLSIGVIYSMNIHTHTAGELFMVAMVWDFGQNRTLT